MNNFIFSPSENAFYPCELRVRYEATGSWPADGLEVDDAVFYEFTGEAPAGKIRIIGSDGLPTWGDVPPLTKDEAIAAAETVKQGLIEQANEFINSQQWPSKLALGRLSDSDKAEFNLWLDYLDAVNSVDTSAAPDIKLPTSPDVQAS
ncbi:tail fiber assembly protein [Enterobacter hormaechei]|uniref:tail fiber assembly protein n=1 Tax=Enterobacter hormaechei TaxID=158836 RepID=UPI00031A838A|nr:tail assembly chaperone [Enterobacter hormaechei]